MIAEDMLTQAQQRCIPDVSFELIPIRNLVSNQEYQRPLSENHIRKALEEFDVYQINPVKVSRRDGINLTITQDDPFVFLFIIYCNPTNPTVSTRKSTC